MITSDSRHTPPEVEEHRNSPRLRINPLVYLNIAPDNGGFLVNLGEGGMSVSVANPLVVTSEVRFSLRLAENQLVQGTGKVCWLSETSRSAGIQFVGLPEDSRNRIRKWLRTEENQANQDKTSETPAEPIPKRAETQTPEPTPGSERGSAGVRLQETGTDTAITDKANSQTNPVLQAEQQRAASSFTLFAPPPPRPTAMPPEPSTSAQPFPESGFHPSIPESPLFFLPSRAGKADEPPSFGPDEKRHYYSQPGGGQWPTAIQERSEETAALQTAILSGSPPTEKDKRKEPRFKGIIVGTAFCAALLALAVMIYGYPGIFTEFQRFVPELGWPSAPQSATQMPSLGSQRQIKSRRAPARHRRGNLSVRNGTVFPAPGVDGTHSPIDATGLLRQPSPGTLTNPSLALGSLPGMISNGSSGSSIRAAAPLSPKITVSMPSPVSNLQFGGMMRELRNDGALVEEGAPVSTPLNLVYPTAPPGPIVVEAEIGKDGLVKNAWLISSLHSRLAQAVVAAVEQWRYRPLYNKGEPVEFTTRITFDFSGADPKR